MRSTFLLERSFFLHLLERSGLSFDTRFVPPSASSSENAVVYLVLDGRFEVDGGPGFDAPATIAMTEDEVEGARGRRASGFRWSCVGEAPFRAIELRARSTDVAPVPGTRAFDVGDDVYARARALLECDHEDEAGLEAAARSLLRGLYEAGVTNRPLDATIAPGDVRHARLWGAARILTERFELLPTLTELSSLSGISLRQLAREIEAFISSFRYPTGQWRELTRRLRLKVAVMGLSARGATVAEVASATGYGSVEAMARAFRDAGLPAPSRVQAQLGGGGPMSR